MQRFSIGSESPALRHSPPPRTNIWACFWNFLTGNSLKWQSDSDWAFWRHYTFVEVHIVVIHVIYFSHGVVLNLCQGKLFLVAGGRISVSGTNKSLKLSVFVAFRVCRRCVARGFERWNWLDLLHPRHVLRAGCWHAADPSQTCRKCVAGVSQVCRRCVAGVSQASCTLNEGIVAMSQLFVPPLDKNCRICNGQWLASPEVLLTQFLWLRHNSTPRKEITLCTRL